MDSTVIPAVAAAGGSLVGAAATIVTTWITHRTQRAHAGREERLRNREALYGQFITEAARLTMEGLSHSLERPDTFVKLYGITGRIRLVATAPVLDAAEACIRRIIDLYAQPNLTVEQIRLTADQVAKGRGGYNPHWHYDHEPETRASLDLIFTDHFSRHEPGVFAALRDTLLTGGDQYMHRADLKSYLEADRRLVELYAGPEGWARQAILNVAGSRKFSSDRTIAEYAASIWNVEPCLVSEVTLQ